MFNGAEGVCGLGGRLAAAAKKLASQGLLVLGPATIHSRLVLKELQNAGHAGVEVIEMVQSQSLKRHRQLGGTKLILAMMAGDHVLEPHR